MATDWSARTAAITYFDNLLKQLNRFNDEDKELYEAALSALRRSQDHTAIQTKLQSAIDALRNLVFMARTAGGTAGHDAALSRACSQAEQLLGQAVPACAKRKPQDMPRKDSEAVAAVPELVGKKALVLYFPSDQARDEFAAGVVAAMKNVRTENL